MQQNKILRIKKLVELPYIYNNNNHDLGLAIKGAGISVTKNMLQKPIRLKNYQKYQALQGLTAMLSNNNNPSIKGASIDSTIEKPNHNHKYNLKLNLISNNPIMNYVNRMNQKVMEERKAVSPCKNKNAMIKGASVIDKQEGIEALQGLSNMLR